LNSLFLRALLITSVVSFLGACSRSSHDQGPIVARVGHSVITQSEFQNRMQQTPAAYQQYASTAEGRHQFLNLLIREKVLLEDARRNSLQKNDRYEEAVDRYKKKQAEDFKDYQESLLIEMDLARLKSHELTVADADVRKYYDAHSEDFEHPQEIQASHILLNTPEDAEKVLDRLKKGESFEALARTVSMDPPTAARGGKLTPFVKGTLLPDFENAIAGLKNGQISGVVKTPFGYHIIKMTGQKALPGKTFDQAKEEIRTRIQREKFDQWVTSKQASIGVTMDEKAIAQVPTPTGMAAGRGESR
jgi:peptidyl-prolyl cis-trans isomerase C